MDDLQRYLLRRHPVLAQRHAEAIAAARDAAEAVRSRANTMSASIQNDGLKMAKSLATRVMDTVLRLPGLILLELWWRNKDVTFDEVTQEMISKAPFNSYLDASTILNFVHRRNFDHSAAIILSYSVIALSIMFLTLPLSRLFRMYSHALSLMLFAFAVYMSTTYIRLEEETNEVELKLDNLVKLERHGFHFLAQILLSMVQSVLLELHAEKWRVFLAMFCLPIVARMCACPLNKLIAVHNISCCMAMVFICSYMLYRMPCLLKAMSVSLRQIRAIFVIRGLAMGCVTVWRKLHIAELMTFTWLTMFGIRMYVELFEKARPWREAGIVLLSGVAESTNTPISLLSLALTVSFVCKWVADVAQILIGGRQDHGNVLVHGGCGYSEAFTLVVLCAQAGFLGMKTEQKAFMLGLVLFIVMSALLQSLYDLLEPELLGLAASPTATRGRHIRCLSLAIFLFFAPPFMAFLIASFLPIDIWCSIIVSNCILTTVHSVATTVQYVVGVIESRSSEPWEGSDDFIFYVACSTRIIELSIAVAVLLHGVYLIVAGEWNVATIIILGFHIVVNIYKRLEILLQTIKSRRAAVNNINRLAKATKEELKAREDVCAICFIEMREDARVTPCKHYFHGPCLRKWLAVKQVCPLCYSEMREDENKPKTENMPNEGRAADQRNQDAREEADWAQPQLPGAWRLPRNRLNRGEHRIQGARDFWPLLVDNEAYQSDASTTSEYTIESSSEEDAT